MDSEVTPNLFKKISEDSISIDQLKNKTDNSPSSYHIYQSLLQDFYGFDHSNTKWILATLSSNLSLKRLKLSGDKYICLLKSYFEIPDNPEHYLARRNEDLKHNLPAFHPLVSLYLNPLGISIYTRNKAALRLLLDLNLNNFSDPCFVQRWWNKGDDTFVTDFSAVHIVALALRRNFFESIPLLMLAGFNPKERIYQVDHIQSCDKSKTHVFQDCLDQALSLVNDLPCLDIGTFFKIITDKNLRNRYDPIVFEKQTVFAQRDGINVKSSRIRSLFRLVIHQASLSCNGKCSSTYLGILEIIQKHGFFRYLYKETCSRNPSKPFLHEKHKLFCEGNFIQSNETEIQRLYKFDMDKLSFDQKVQCLQLDRNICIATLLLWCSEVNAKGRQHQKYRLTKILVFILFDSNLMVWFLKSSNSVVVESFSLSCCGIDNIKVEDISKLRVSIIDFLRYRDSLKKRILSENDEDLCNLFDKKNKFLKMTIRKKTQRNKKTPYLVLDARSMHSWNSSKKSNTLTKDLPMFSLQHKMGKMIRSVVNESPENMSAVFKIDANDDDTITEANPLLSVTNSFNSFGEKNSINSFSQTVFNPPPLVIRKLRPAILAPPRLVKKLNSTLDSVDIMTELSNKQKDSLTVVEEVF